MNINEIATPGAEVLTSVPDPPWQQVESDARSLMSEIRDELRAEAPNLGRLEGLFSTTGDKLVKALWLRQAAGQTPIAREKAGPADLDPVQAEQEIADLQRRVHLTRLLERWRREAEEIDASTAALAEAAIYEPGFELAQAPRRRLGHYGDTPISLVELSRG